MVKYVKESDVEKILDMPTTVELVDKAFRDWAEGLAIDVPRNRTIHALGNLHVLQAASETINKIGLKAYYVRPTARTFLIILIDQLEGHLRGLIEARHLGFMRTGAASGVATRVLARSDADTVACIGSGGQAVTQLHAVCAVRKIKNVRVLAHRNRERAQAFCNEAERQLGVTASLFDNAAEAIKGAHIINVMTRSETPVLSAEMLEPGQHINAVGVNVLSNREIGLDTLKRCDLIVVDSTKVAEREGGDLLPAIERGLLSLDRIPDLGQVLTGRSPTRSSAQDITLFKSHGMGIEDLYVADYVLTRAEALGVGSDLPL